MELNTQITLLSLAGFIGIIDYWILKYTNLISFFDTNKTDEKTAFITIAGFINIGLYEYFSELITDIYLLVLSMFIMSLILLIILLWSIGNLVFFINRYMENKGKPHKIINLNFESYLIDKLRSYELGDSYYYVQIMDFNDKLICKGFIDQFHEDNSIFNMSLESLDKNIFRDEFDFEELEKLDDVYIDFNHKIKIYVNFIDQNNIKDT